jgi:hypothetical protein
MKRVMLLMLAAVICVGAAGCYVTPVQPPRGWIVSNIRAPLSADNQEVRVAGQKMGTATVETYLGIIATGDCSIEEAAKDVKISKISYVDYEYFNVLGVYQRFTVIVHGD